MYMYLYVDIVHVFWCSVHVCVHTLYMYMCTFYVHSVHVRVCVCTSESPPGTSNCHVIGCLSLFGLAFLCVQGSICQDTATAGVHDLVMSPSLML